MGSSSSLALPLNGSSHAPSKKKKKRRRRTRAVTTTVVAVVVVAATRMTRSPGPAPAATMMSGLRMGRGEGKEVGDVVAVVHKRLEDRKRGTTTEGMRTTTSIATGDDGDTVSSSSPPPSSWLPFSSANDLNYKQSSRISYRLWRLHDTLAYRQRYGFNKHNCIAGHQRRRVWPREHVIEAVGVVDFQTHITTSMKIAVVGDSVGVQIAHRLEEAMWDEEEDADDKGEDVKAAEPIDTTTRTVRHSRRRVVHVDRDYQYASVSHPIRGNGTLVTYRANGLFQRRRTRDQRQHEPPNQQLEPNRRHRQRRKLQEFFRAQPYNQTILDLVMDHPTLARSGGNRGVDVLVQRIVYPWIRLDQITYESLVENAQVATEMFGMETLVLINMYFCNNVVGPTMYRQYLHRLHVIRNFTLTYRPSSHSSSLQRILLLDMDRLGDALNEANGRSLGFDTVHEPFEKWMVSHYMGPNVTGRLFRRHIGQVCSTRVPDHSTRCPPNMVWVDGLHFCPSTWAGRLTAGIACLIDCGEQHHNDQLQSSSVTDGDNASSWTFLRKCERHCNDKFMSLTPIPMSEMVS